MDEGRAHETKYQKKNKAKNNCQKDKKKKKSFIHITSILKEENPTISSDFIYLLLLLIEGSFIQRNVHTHTKIARIRDQQQHTPKKKFESNTCIQKRRKKTQVIWILL